MSRYPIQPVKIRDELTCDCDKNCASHGPEYQQFHDCEIIEELFKQIPTVNLQNRHADRTDNLIILSFLKLRCTSVVRLRSVDVAIFEHRLYFAFIHTRNKN